jgi:hypothetical protein
MSGDFFRFWRYIQRFTLGTIVGTEIVILFLGNRILISFFSTALGETNSTLSLLNNFAILISIMLIFGVFGTLLINILVGFFAAITRPLVKIIVPIKNLNSKLSWYDFFLHSVDDIALQLIQANINDHIEHFILRSLGESQPNNVIKRVESFYLRVKTYLINIKDSNHFFMLSYQGTLTQEQRALENLEWDVNSVRTLLVIIELGLVIVYENSVISVFLLLLLILILPLIFLPELINRKRKYISYLIAISGSIFQLGEGAEMVDRESI